MLGLSNGYDDREYSIPVIVIVELRWSWFSQTEFWYALVSLFLISLIVSNGALYIGNSGDRLNQITIRLQTRSWEIFSPQVSRESRLLNVLFNCWLTWSSNDQVTLLVLSFGLLQIGPKLKGAWALYFWACGLFLATTVCPPLSSELPTK